jgi:hypothetical protein
MKFYSLISCPQGDWHEVIVNQRNARCIGKSISYRGVLEVSNNETSATRVSYAARLNQWATNFEHNAKQTWGAIAEVYRQDAATARALAAHVEQIQQWADVNPECEVRVSSEYICGKETWYWYPADGGGTMALCEQHAENRAYAKPLPRVWDICHSLAAGFDPNAAIHPEGP